MGEIARCLPGFSLYDMVEKLTLHIERQCAKGAGEVSTAHFFSVVCVF